MTWFLMVITFGAGPVEKAYAPFSDEMSCGNAIPAIHNGFATEYPEVSIKCEDSGVAKVRPRARP